MNKNICYVIIAGMILMFTGCCIPPPSGGNTRVDSKNDQLLAGRETPYGNNTGMIHSLREEKIKVPTKKDFSSCCTISSTADETKPRPLGIRSSSTYITGGPNINFKSAGDDVYAEGSHKPGIGFQFGFRTEYRFNDSWSVVPGFLFKQNNASEVGEIRDGEPPAPTIDIKDKYSYNYLSAPILAQYNLTDELMIMAGPEVNYLLKSKVKSEASYNGDTNENEEDLTDNSVKLGVGVQVGLKYEFPDSRWGIELIYDHRISRLNEKNPEGYGNYEVPAWRMKSVQLGVTCKICDLLKGKKNQGTNN